MTQPADLIQDADRLFLESAFDLSEKALHLVTWNNPRVGCVIVREGQVIAHGWHKKDGGPHAEVEALRQIPEGRAKGATAYVTLEPCCWEGRTPACTDLLIRSGIKKVVIGQRDPHPKVDGGGVRLLEEAGVSVVEIPSGRNASINPGQVKRLKTGLPYVRIKMAMSLDGRTALASGESQWITGPESRADVQYWRARSGAIVTGIGTVLQDDPGLDVRDERYTGAEPWRIVLDTKARMPADAAIWRRGGPVVLVVGKDKVGVGGAQTWVQPSSDIDPYLVLKRLASEGCNEVLVEAGARVAGSFIKAGLWDQQVIYIAPKLMGSSARPLGYFEKNSMQDMIDGTIASTQMFGNDLRVIVNKG